MHRLRNDPPPGTCVWLTGVSGAGKTTLATLLHQHLSSGGKSVEVLDGDVIRARRAKPLGFSRADRDRNVDDIAARAARAMAPGHTVLVAAISPYREARERARDLLSRQGRFIEVHVDVPIAVAAQRDPKGLYAKAARGEISGLTGVDDPYEAPLAPELVIRTAGETPEESLAPLLALLKRRVPLTAAGAPRVDASRAPATATPR